MSTKTNELHDLLVGAYRAEFRKYSSYLLEPDHDRTLILTTHLIIERLLEDIISTVLVHPQIWLRDATFRSKVNLTRALGLIERREVNICNVINAARNGIAHTLEPLPEKWKKELERLAYAPDSGVRPKKDGSMELHDTLRILFALIGARALKAMFHYRLRQLRQDNSKRWQSLWAEKLFAYITSEQAQHGISEEELKSKWDYEVDLIMAREAAERTEGGEESG